MTTPPPDQQPAAETLEEIATKVVNQIAVGAWQYCSRQWVIGLVTDALRNERERCANVAETAFREFETGYNAGKWIAAAIREGK